MFPFGILFYAYSRYILTLTDTIFVEIEYLTKTRKDTKHFKQTIKNYPT